MHFSTNTREHHSQYPNRWTCVFLYNRWHAVFNTRSHHSCAAHNTHISFSFQKIFDMCYEHVLHTLMDFGRLFVALWQSVWYVARNNIYNMNKSMYRINRFLKCIECNRTIDCETSIGTAHSKNETKYGTLLCHCTSIHPTLQRALSVNNLYRFKKSISNFFPSCGAKRHQTIFGIVV